MTFPGRRARISVALSALLLVLLAIPVLDQYLFRYDWARTTLADIERRHARLLGFKAAEAPIMAALAKASESLTDFAYPAGEGADRVGADLQQRVRALAQQAGVSVVGSQILPARQAEALEVVRLALTLEAEMESLRDFLAALGAERPGIQLESMVLTAPRQRGARSGGTAKTRAQLQLNAMRLGA